MGSVTIRYYVTRKSSDGPASRTMGYWAPCLARRSKISGQIEPTLMAKLGFKIVDCGEDGPRAWATAKMWNDRWDVARKQFMSGVAIESIDTPAKIAREYPPGSLGEAFGKLKQTGVWTDLSPATHLQWERGWKQIDPIFGDVDPATVSLQDLDSWYAAVLEATSVHEAFLAMKIWRALWRKAGTLNKPNGDRYCDRDKDPSLGIRRKTPPKRSATWQFDEVRRLVKTAWRMKYYGLAATLAVAWDTMLSPVDVRGLTTGQLTPDPKGPLFSLARAKTGKAAIGSVSHKTERILAAYIKHLSKTLTLHPNMPIFHTRGGEPIALKGTFGKRGGNLGGGRRVPPQPYQKDVLGKDFRVVRDVAFPGDERKIMDFRRSGAVEATAGQVDPAALAGKMANSIDTNRDLQATYQPHSAALVRLADEARARGRPLLRRTGTTDGEV